MQNMYDNILWKLLWNKLKQLKMQAKGRRSLEANMSLAWSAWAKNMHSVLVCKVRSLIHLGPQTPAIIYSSIAFLSLPQSVEFLRHRLIDGIDEVLLLRGFRHPAMGQCQRLESDLPTPFTPENFTFYDEFMEWVGLTPVFGHDGVIHGLLHGLPLTPSQIRRLIFHPHQSSDSAGFQPVNGDKDWMHQYVGTCWDCEMRAQISECANQQPHPEQSHWATDWMQSNSWTLTIPIPLDSTLVCPLLPTPTHQTRLTVLPHPCIISTSVRRKSGVMLHPKSLPGLYKCRSPDLLRPTCST